MRNSATALTLKIHEFIATTHTHEHTHTHTHTHLQSQDVNPEFWGAATAAAYSGQRRSPGSQMLKHETTAGKQ